LIAVIQFVILHSLLDKLTEWREGKINQNRLQATGP